MENTILRCVWAALRLQRPLRRISDPCKRVNSVTHEIALEGVKCSIDQFFEKTLRVDKTPSRIVEMGMVDGSDLGEELRAVARFTELMYEKVPILVK